MSSKHKGTEKNIDKSNCSKVAVLLIARVGGGVVEGGGQQSKVAIYCSIGTEHCLMFSQSSLTSGLL